MQKTVWKIYRKCSQKTSEMRTKRLSNLHEFRGQLGQRKSVPNLRKVKLIRNAKPRKSFGRVIKFHGFEGPTADHFLVDKSMKNVLKSLKKSMKNQCFFDLGTGTRKWWQKCHLLTPDLEAGRATHKTTRKRIPPDQSADPPRPPPKKNSVVSGLYPPRPPRGEKKREP